MDAVGAVGPQNNDYSFAQLSSTDSATSHLVYNNQSNTFGINFKQIFQAGNNFAGLNIAGVGSDPNSANLQPGDFWFNTGSNHLNFRDGSGNTKALAFTGDGASGDGSGLTNLNASQLSSGTLPVARLSGTYGISISGNAASITGTVPESQVTNLTTDLGISPATLARKPRRVLPPTPISRTTLMPNLLREPLPTPR